MSLYVLNYDLVCPKLWSKENLYAPYQFITSNTSALCSSRGLHCNLTGQKVVLQWYWRVLQTAWRTEEQGYISIIPDIWQYLAVFQYTHIAGLKLANYVAKFVTYGWKSGVNHKMMPHTFPRQFKCDIYSKVTNRRRKKTLKEKKKPQYPHNNTLYW